MMRVLVLILAINLLLQHRDPAVNRTLCIQETLLQVLLDNWQIIINEVAFLSAIW